MKADSEKMEGREKILIVLVVNPVNPELTSGQRRVSNDFAFEESSGPALAFASREQKGRDSP